MHVSTTIEPDADAITTKLLRLQR